MVRRSWSSGNTAYEYDLQGNLLAATGTEGRTAFSYNAFNQQTAVAMPNGNRLESRYHAEYLRAGTTQNGSVTSFLYYNGELLAESSPDGDTISRYILGYGVAAGWNREKEGYHPYHLDEQYSTAYITGVNGEIENHYQYDAFGVVRTHQEEIHNRIFYTGQQYDQSSGQYYLRARYYNPVVGRFLQEDTHRDDGLNLYAYCENNPVIWIDDSGFAKKRNTKNATRRLNNTTEIFIRHIGSDEAAAVFEAMQKRKPEDPIEVLRPKVDKFGTVHRSAKWISEKGCQRDQKALGGKRDYTLIMETEMGTKEWLKSKSTKDSKEVRNRDKVIMKDQEAGSYGVGIELLDEYNSKIVSATLVDKNEKKIQTCKKS